ncbi:hypothetical protein PRIPAC_82680 [Pristionchus pacificus]|uniref:Uncharacterized protein n=1 Tax=Pristionchus pacificus TaxID=54126 RepID=A0A2A6CLC7_PRIPA|nr:hypothetical protein PRIPAC_82680 [Pristionchus pacificus]|eukprot:PDM78877.1 hypothetical protein PRIPAC_31456 [Pristionchus pacificus]
MSEEQSDLPGPLNVDADKLEVTYIRRGPNHPSHPSQAAQTVLRPWLSYPGPMTRLPLGRLSAPLKIVTWIRVCVWTSKRIACCLCGVLLFAFGVYGGIFYYFFSSSSSYTITTYAPRAPIAPMAPAAPASHMEPPRPTGPVDPISHPSNIPDTFYNQSWTLLPALLRFNVDLMTQFKNRMEDGVWDRENPTKLPKTRTRNTRSNTHLPSPETQMVKYSIRKVNDPLPRVALDCDQAVYTDSSTDVDRARSSVQKVSRYIDISLVERVCRVLLFALVFGEFKSAILEVANHTAGRENRQRSARELCATQERRGRSRSAPGWSPKKKSSPKLDSSPMKVDSSPLDVDSSPAKYENYTPTGEYREAISPVVCVLKVML